MGKIFFSSDQVSSKEMIQCFKRGTRYGDLNGAINGVMGREDRDVGQ